jgi:magnesium chelatase family protein
MSLAVVRSRAITGMWAPAVEVEVQLANGLPSFTIVGLPEAEVKESKDRVRAAIQNSQFEFPSSRRITVNLAPADLPKESGRYDLPIAIGILAASGQLPTTAAARYEYAGELSLSGELRPVVGALAMACALNAQKQTERLPFILPSASAAEAALVDGVEVYGAPSLLAVCAHVLGQRPEDGLPRQTALAAADTGSCYPDLTDIKGQLQARRALEVAAAGKHSLLMVGPPGSGKSMLALRLPGILPPMTHDEALQAAAMQSLSGRGFNLSLWRQRPFRAPHHTASSVALVGGGSSPRPGEISLAHEGVLFLDELPEFDRKVLEVLREPLESGRITVSRAARQVDFEAAFQLVAAMNPCPCGHLGHPVKRCLCSPDQIARYQGKISGPLLDRIDLQVTVPAMPHQDLMNTPPGESSTLVRERVCCARERQMARQGKPNQALGVADIDRYAAPDAQAVKILRTAMERFGWSARSYHRVLRVARTIADLAGADLPNATHVAEAIQYRRGLNAAAQ